MANDTDKDLSPQEDRIWLAVVITECILIFIINAFTLIIFAKNRHLRKRSTYLIINLTVADLLVGAVQGPLGIFDPAADIIERDLEHGESFSWQAFIIFVFQDLFFVASLANISFISLERLHATIYPFRHCLIGEWVYFKIILCSWFIALLITFLLTFIDMCEQVAFSYVFSSYIFFTLLILTVSYAMIVSNIKSNPHSQNFGSILLAERKLTVTLFIITVISYLTILPFASGDAIYPDKRSKPRFFEKASLFLFWANSIVNPLIYAIRMEEFRKAAKELICKITPESMRVQPIELPTV